MMTKQKIAAVSVLIALAGSARGETLYGPLQGNTLELADHMVSLYYTDEGDYYEVVTTLGANANHDYLSRFTAQLSDGEDYHITLGGYGSNRTLVTLTISRSGAQVRADIHTDSDTPNSPQLSLND